MNTLLLLALLASEPAIPVLAAETGVTAANLSATPATLGINMEASRATRTLSLLLAVTPGTTTVVDVTCYESSDGTHWATVNVCDATSPKRVCAPDVRSYTLANYTGSVRYLSSSWAITKKWAKCTADDAADGTGTVSVTGSRD